MYKSDCEYLEEQRNDAGHTQDQAIWYDHTEVVQYGMSSVLVRHNVLFVSRRRLMCAAWIMLCASRLLFPGHTLMRELKLCKEP